VNRESWPLLIGKALIAAAAVWLFLSPLATTAGVLAGVIGTIAGYAVARLARERGLRVVAALAFAAVGGGAAHLAGRSLLDHPFAASASGIAIADALALFLGTASLFLAIRTLSSAWRPFAILEVGVVVAAVARTFASHRHHHINEPRFLTDWAWSHGIDPILILEGCGVAAIFVAAVLMFELRRASKLVVSLVFLAATCLIAFQLLREIHIEMHPDTNGIGLGSDKDEGSATGSQSGSGTGSGTGSGNSSGGGGGKPPDPVAVLVLHDELPTDLDILYLRQAVLSKFTVDRLGDDTTGQYDLDVARTFPTDEPVRAPSSQSPSLNSVLHTSMYLLVDHAQPFGLGQPFELAPRDNPDTRRFVASYDVSSYVLHDDLSRLVGYTAGSPSWSADERAHYLAMPSDPRYRELSDRIVRDMDPRFVGDDLMKAFTLKRYLETHGFYSLAQKTLVGTDPTAKFLFGEMRGYCVHFAHAMVFLLRSQGIPARVALGYAVQTQRHNAGSSILVFGNEAHAWPELYLDGVGWVTFDIYPEKSDEPAQPPVDEDLEITLGELAHKDKTGGKAGDPDATLEIPWRVIADVLGGLAGAMLVACYAIALARRLRRSSPRAVYVGVLDHVTALGLGRREFETRERHAARLAAIAPSFEALTRAHLRRALGGAAAPLPEVVELARQTRAELAAKVSLPRRLGAWLVPIAWLFTR
jgi:transglutaminase-like putative cysteine protease/uncharacterized membrane protein YgcG